MRVGITDSDGCPPPRKGATRDPDRRRTTATVHLAIELSRSAWLVAARLPGVEKPSLHRIEGGDTAALLALVAALRARAAARLGAPVRVACCFEAGRDGFWLHRLLTAEGLAAHVLEPTSILVSRRARRAKTDRLDALGMLRVLAAYLGGDRQVCSMVRVPTPEEEDAKRPHREREDLVRERVRLENRIAALLATQGVRERPSLRSWERDLAALRTGDGRPLPPHLRAELDRLRRRLVLTLELIREVEAERDAALAAEPRDAVGRKIAALCRIRGVGANFAAVLAREVFYRAFANRRQLAGYVGLDAGAAPERRGRPRPADQPRRQRQGPDHPDPARLAVAALPARQRAGAVVPRPGRGLAGPHAADRDRGDGEEAADRALALRRDRPRARGCRGRGVAHETAAAGTPAGGGAGSATVFVEGGSPPPRSRWVAPRRGHASCKRHSGAGPGTGPDRM